MMVALDGREFVAGRQTGIARYLGCLVDAARCGGRPWKLTMVSPPGFRVPDGAAAVRVGSRDGWRWDLLRLPAYLRAASARAYVTPYVKFRPSTRYRVVAVVCDPADVLADAGAPRLRRAMLPPLRRALLERAAMRVTISEWSRAEIARALGLREESFRVVYPGVTIPGEPAVAGEGDGRVARRRGEAGRIETRAAVAPAGDVGRYVLHLSNGKRHKNVPRLLRAYSALPAALQRAHPLVVAGLHDARRTEIERAARGLEFASTPRFVGHVDERELRALYAGAALFAFPSLTEGFGIPPLEAMLCGVPVVASTAGALRETLADAALLVDPRDESALSQALEAVLTRDEVRARLAARGLAHARRFSPERTGAALAAAIDEAVAEAAP